MEQAILMAREDNEMWAVLACETIIERIGNECGWISVGEQMPEINTYVITFSWYQQLALFSLNEDWYVFQRQNIWDYIENVTHWMELPKNPL